MSREVASNTDIMEFYVFGGIIGRLCRDNIASGAAEEKIVQAEGRQVDESNVRLEISSGLKELEQALGEKTPRRPGSREASRGSGGCVGSQTADDALRTARPMGRFRDDTGRKSDRSTNATPPAPSAQAPLLIRAMIHALGTIEPPCIARD
ncbi:unnamed protein product [Heligmosomoides polygyrus]|uniref:Protein kinase domain-containing protein n=1 Tax=Heligmosomoides polygyrus TaxID=6339 RepID=A0A183FUV8_HELPZ|nr:unnamed protein product [Heligmosomoides polygyrus]